MRLFGLIGYPLGHSFSAGYFSEKFRDENIKDCEYRNFPISNIEELPSIIRDHPELRGLNVTIPYKKAVIPFLRRLHSPASDIGAVNTMRIIRDEKSNDTVLEGYNTDVFGFLSSVRVYLSDKVRKALILGTGGASSAVKYSLENSGITTKMVSRERSRANFSYEDLNREIMDNHLLIVNTTPLGTYPEVDQAPPIPYEFLDDNHILYDLVYNPEETLFMKKGKDRGAQVKNGYDMLVGQAEKAWEIWNR